MASSQQGKMQPDAPQQAATSMQGLEVLLLRASSEGRIEYVNRAFSAFVGLSRESLVGNDLSALHRLGHTPLVNTLVPPTEKGSSDREVVDDDGRHYSVRITKSDTVVDFVIQDVTDKNRFRSYVEKYVGRDLASLSEEDLLSFRFPERRFMTVSFSDLRGFTPMTEKMRPEEARAVLNAYLDAAIHAVDANGATVDKIVGDALMVLYGAPRYYRDHAIRALKTCTEQLANIATARREYARLGKVIPGCGIGVHTGDMILGNMGGATRQDYTVVGANVNLASRLCGAAEAGQILTSEATLRAVTDAMPDGWRAQEVAADPCPPPRPASGGPSGMVPLEMDRGKAVLVGPPDQPEFRFTYLWAMRLKGISTPVPLLAVERCDKGAGVQLSDAVAASGESVRLMGRYQLLKKVGQGGVGEVWMGRDSFGNVVAVKILRALDSVSEKAIGRFRREAEIMRMLSHRNICRIHEVGEAEGVTYIAMEYIDGVSLAGLLAYHGDCVTTDAVSGTTDLPTLMRVVKTASSSGSGSDDGDESRGGDGADTTVVALPFQQTVSLMVQVCEAVQFAHEHGVMHRDLKPSNIMLRPDGEPVVMDFGLAKMATPTDQMSLSVTGEVMGTIEYMAPEQARSCKDVREQADVYALGSILYRMITGRLSFRSSGNILEDVQRLQHHDPIPPRKLNPRIDEELEVIALKALRNDMGGRYHSVSALKRDLESYQRGEPVSARRMTPAERLVRFSRRNKALTRAVAGMATACVIVVGVLLWNQGRERRANYDRFLREAETAEARHDWDSAVSSLQSAVLLAPGRNLDERIRQLHLRSARQMISREEWGAAAIRIEKATGGRTDDPEIRQMMLAALGEGTVSVSAPFVGVLGESRPTGREGTNGGDSASSPGTLTYGTLPVEGLALREGYHDLFLDSPKLGRIHLPVRVERGKRLAVDLPFSEIPEGYVYVHGGPFLYGGDSTVHSNGVVGARELDIPAFFIMRRPVLLAEYAGFYESPGFDAIMQDVLRKANVTPAEIERGATTVKDLKAHLYGEVSHPTETARGISYWEALAYARWKGARLPTEQEWEKAARGVDGRLFVSGNRPSTVRSVSTMVRLPEPAEIEVSPYGCYGLTQVLSQWTSSEYDAMSLRRVVKGSIASTLVLEARVTCRRDRDPAIKYLGVGLILCKDVETGRQREEKRQ
jgi:serine/threonine protein kinase/class 3 adenylate cyclase